MSASGDYLDRLKNIREKYGCSQPKTQSGYSDQLLAAERPMVLERPLGYERNTGAGSYYKESYGLDKMKIVDPHIPATTLASKNMDYQVRPQSSIGLGTTQGYGGMGDYTRKADREREIDQIRQNYAASRRKVIEDFSAKTYTRDYSKEMPKDYLKSEKDYLRSQKDYLKSDKDYMRDYARLRDEPRAQIPITSTKIDLLGRGEESVSPIKRMSDYDEKKSYRQREVEPSDTFWREREAKLSEFTANRLNENTRSSILKDDKYMDQKIHTAKRSGLYDQIKAYPEPQSLARMDLQNKPDGYSVTNIDRIQQRIQSILGAGKR